MAAHGHDAHGAHGHHGHADANGDKAAAFVGLVGGMVLLGAMVFGVVKWTNGQYAGHGAGGAEKPAAAATAGH